MGTKTGNPVWKNKDDGSTPISATALNNIEDALDDLEDNGGGGVGTVTKVAGKSPDSAGNVVLAPGDIGAATTAQVAAKVGSPNSSVTGIEFYPNLAALPNVGVVGVLYAVDRG